MPNEIIKDLLGSAKMDAKAGSKEVERFETIVNENSESMARAFSNTDENKDGSINREPFRAC